MATEGWTLRNKPCEIHYPPKIAKIQPEKQNGLSRSAGGWIDACVRLHRRDITTRPCLMAILHILDSAMVGQGIVSLGGFFTMCRVRVSRPHL
ncbi:hypothetical protein EYF80_044710 [Liparis tanakae]|uniref:Uncharacterized protein n=1 Tax=Liparis tanakae TaxID=230148 RepID=A0A4Z2FV62_9TELE|nr:hypothetical protein EYF80_044710 [Liparis tanakae]